MGCKPNGRNIEQHDIYFGIGDSIRELLPGLVSSWPGEHKIHLDAWREVTQVDGYQVEVIPAHSARDTGTARLFFINLGGYKQGEFEEFHYKMLVAAEDKATAVDRAKQTAFYRHTGFEGANSHIDDKYGVDVDDVYEITDILPPGFKQKFKLSLHPVNVSREDEVHLGYFKLSSFE
jgi:hypothetical protein